MPLFLIHGFRWSRKDIRIFIILNNLADASADYIMSPLSRTPQLLLHTLRRKYPHLLTHLPDLAFIEQHDPEDLHTGAQPYAFVADRVVRTDLSVDLGECMSQSLGVNAWDAMADLRDELAGEEKVGWWAVWNGDVDRADLGNDFQGGRAATGAVLEDDEEEDEDDDDDDDEDDDDDDDDSGEGSSSNRQGSDGTNGRSTSSGKVSLLL